METDSEQRLVSAHVLRLKSYRVLDKKEAKSGQTEKDYFKPFEPPRKGEYPPARGLGD